MNKIYDFLFGTEYGKSVFTSQESKLNNCFILYKHNTLSSISYIISGIYIKYFTKSYPLISYTISNNLIFLGIISSLWWATQRLSIQLIDIGLYSTMLSTIGFYSLAIYLNQDKNINNIYILTTILFNLYPVFSKLKYIKLINILSCLFSVISLLFIINKSPIYSSIGLFITLLSLIFKLNDSFNFLDYKLPISGTAIFHWLSGLGIYILWKAFQ